MWRTASHAAVWGDRPEMGMIEEIRSWTRMAVRVTCCGTPDFAVLSSAHDEEGQAALVERDAAVLAESADQHRFRERMQRPELLQFCLAHPHADVRPPPFAGDCCR